MAIQTLKFFFFFHLLLSWNFFSHFCFFQHWTRGCRFRTATWENQRSTIPKIHWSPDVRQFLIYRSCFPIVFMCWFFFRKFINGVGKCTFSSIRYLFSFKKIMIKKHNLIRSFSNLFWCDRNMLLLCLSFCQIFNEQSSNEIFLKPMLARKRILSCKSTT